MRKFMLLVALAILASAPAQRRGTELHISFSGVICHVFDATHAPRAVAMRGSGSMLHHATLHMPQASIDASDVPLSCDDGDCVLELRDTALRFAGAGRAHYAAGGTFDTIVPHLRRVTNGEMSALRDEVFDEVPSPESVVSASMELPAGSLSATPAAMTGHYDPDFENRGERSFPDTVYLNGLLPAPELLVRRFGDASWHRITFKDDVELRMTNEPAAGVMPMQHEMLFYDLSAQPLSTKPLIVLPSTAPIKIGPNTLGQADCSSSQFP